MLKPKGCETMDNEKSTMGLTTERKPGGLYRNVKISVKTADRLILVVENDPVKEGYVFTVWYSDRDCTKAFDISKDTVNESITLYSGWDKAE